MDQILSFLLEVSSSLGWIVGISLFFLLLFHILLIHVFCLTSAQWKLVEYVWISLAFLSVLGLVDESRRYRAEVSVEMYKNAAEDKFRDVYGWFENYREFTCEQQVEQSAAPDQETPQQDKTDFAGLCEGLSLIVNDLDFIIEHEDDLPAISPPMMKTLEQLPPLLTDIEKNIISTRISIYHDKLSTYHQSVENSEQSFMQKLLVILTPLFLAAALALKMTKVTGEYRIIKTPKK